MVELSSTERRVVETALTTTHNRRQWVRLRALVLAADGVPSPAVCRHLGLGRSTLFAWLAAWRATRDPAALADAPRSGHPPVLNDGHRTRLAQLLAEPPEQYGYKTVGWTVSLLAYHFAVVERVPVSETTLRRVLHALGYRWKRPRYVLARRDPERAEKKGGPRGRGGARAPGGAAHRGAHGG